MKFWEFMILPCATARTSSLIRVSAGRWWGVFTKLHPFTIKMAGWLLSTQPSTFNNRKLSNFMMEVTDVREETFPARSREANGLVNGVATEVTATNFADKILITISQEGRLSQWVTKPLVTKTVNTIFTNTHSRFKFL